MIVTNCTQCGAIIADITDGSTFADCDYCGARFLIPHQVTQDSAFRPAAANAIEPFRAAPFSLPYGARIVLIAIGVGFLLLVAGGTFAVIQQKKEREALAAYRAERDAAQRKAGEKPAPFTDPSWTVSNDPPKPLPVVNYQPRVSWDGPNDIQHFASPEVDISSVSHLTSEEVEKTVFKDRNVRLRVVINTEGEIDEVETISGHPLLVAAATQSAKESIFAPRKNPTKRVLTYTFRIVKD